MRACCLRSSHQVIEATFSFVRSGHVCPLLRAEKVAIDGHAWSGREFRGRIHNHQETSKPCESFQNDSSASLRPVFASKYLPRAVDHSSFLERYRCIDMWTPLKMNHRIPSNSCCSLITRLYVDDKLVSYIMHRPSRVLS